MRIQQRFILGMAVIFGFVALTTVWFELPVRGSQAQLRSLHDTEVRQAMHLHHAAQNARIAAISFQLTADRQNVRTFYESMEAVDHGLRALQRSPLMWTSERESRQMRVAATLSSKMKREASPAFSGQGTPEGERAAAQRQLLAASAELIENTEGIADGEAEEEQEAIEGLERTLDGMSAGNLWTAAVAIVLAAGLSSILSRSIIRPLVGLTRTASTISEGDLETPFAIAGSGEVRQLCESCEHMRLGMRRALEERQQAELALTGANEQLGESLRVMERGAQQQALVHHMSEMLQSGLSLTEAYVLVGHFAGKMFPDSSGAVYASSSSTELLERVGRWGDDSGIEDVVHRGECWALRTGKPVVTSESDDGIPCEHAVRAGSQWSACYPMNARSGLLGLLYVRWPDAAAMRYVKQDMAHSFASRAALSLLNVRLQHSLREQSTRDPLTGLFNRRFMEESFEQEIARASRSHLPLSVLMIDVDHFKQVNDIRGHAIGDKLLTRLGRFLLDESRGSDTVCRYGGEEFVIIWPEMDRASAIDRAEEIRAQVHSLGADVERGIELSISIGIAVFPDDGMDVDWLISVADHAMYTAKNEGRDRVVTVAPVES